MLFLSYCRLFLTITLLNQYYAAAGATETSVNFDPLPIEGMETSVQDHVKPIPLDPPPIDPVGETKPYPDRPFLGIPPVQYPPTIPYGGVPPAKIPETGNPDDVGGVKPPFVLPPAQYPPTFPYNGVPPASIPQQNNDHNSEIKLPWNLPPVQYPPTMPYAGVPPAQPPKIQKPSPFYGIPPVNPQGQDYFSNNQPTLGIRIPTQNELSDFFYGILPVGLDTNTVQTSSLLLPALIQSLPKTMPIPLPLPTSKAVCPNGVHSSSSCFPGAMLQSGCGPAHACFFDANNKDFGCCAYDSLKPANKPQGQQSTNMDGIQTTINGLDCVCTCSNSTVGLTATKCVCDCD